MSKLKPYLIMAAILGIMVTGVQVFFIVRGWQSGETLDISSYLSPLPSKIPPETLNQVKERENALEVKKL